MKFRKKVADKHMEMPKRGRRPSDAMQKVYAPYPSQHAPYQSRVGFLEFFLLFQGFQAWLGADNGRPQEGSTCCCTADLTGPCEAAWHEGMQHLGQNGTPIDSMDKDDHHHCWHLWWRAAIWGTRLNLTSHEPRRSSPGPRSLPRIKQYSQPG